MTWKEGRRWKPSTYAQVYDWDNLYLAWRKAARGKRGRVAAARFEYHLEDNLVTLQEELAAQTYRPGPYASSTSTSRRNG